MQTNSVQNSEIVEIRKNGELYQIRYEWSNDLDPDGRIAAITWKLNFRAAWQTAKQQFMFNSQA
ncbi:hypothetical protein [Leptolyngbya sp. AN10]|uniref:hypothetical protein n=1 Tax=Leptolyngbya sp. AN10 TaxID=3423365 RepID=UPI003D314AD9